MKLKYSIAFILAILICFFKPYNVYALYPSTDVVPASGGSDLDFSTYWENVWTIHFLESADHTSKKQMTLDEYMAEHGFITNQEDYTKTKYVVKTIIENNPDAFGGKTENEVTQEDMDEWLQNNITVNNYADGNVQFSTSGEFNGVVNKIENDIMDETGYKLYRAFDIFAYNTNFSNGDLYNALVSVCSQYQEDYYIIKVGNGTKVILIPMKKYGFMSAGTNSQFAHMVAAVSFQSWTTAPDDDDYIQLDYDTATKQFIRNVDLYRTNVYGWAEKSYSTQNNISNSSAYISYKKRIFMPYFSSSDAFKNFAINKAPYYITDTYENTVKDSYNTSTDNIDNSIKYDTVNNYITDSYNTNNDYPSPYDITDFIRNYDPNPTPTPTQNPNSGDNGSGESGSSGSGDTNIFDWLSRIGSVLGNLIKNLGNVLAELVESIASVISNLFESIPTIFNDFLGGVIGWLPPELRALITLSISAMVIVGLIKMFKG